MSDNSRERVTRVIMRACGISAADLVTEGVRVLMIYAPVRPGAAAMFLLEIGRNGLVLGFGLALALEVRNSPVFDRRPIKRRFAVILAAALAVAVSSLTAATREALDLGAAASAAALRFYIWWSYGMVAIVAVAFLSRRLETQQAEQNHAMMVERLAQARQRLSGIADQTIQAWIEPQMVFDCLSRARAAYQNDLAQGDVVLSRMARCLRLMLDIASNADPTLGHEAELAAARLDVERDEADSPLHTQVESRAAMARFPRGMLAVVVREWVRDPAADAPRAVRLHADRDGRALRVRLDGPCAPPDAMRLHAAERLNGFAGQRASLRVEAHTLHMEIVHG